MPEIKNLKVNVVGTSGSGKTTFSKKLSQILNIPYVEMDSVFWGPDWHLPTDEEFFIKLKSRLNLHSWILDGNYTRTIPIKWKDINIVIWLDFSFLLTLCRVIKRAVSRSFSQKELWKDTGNKESFKKMLFSKESIVLWMITSYKRVSKNYLNLSNNPKYSHITFIRIKSPHQASIFFQNIELFLNTET